MAHSDDNHKEQFCKENGDKTRLKYQIKGVTFLFICFVIGFLVTFSLMKFI